MSDETIPTPRTDEMAYEIQEGCNSPETVVSVNFARQLERELTQEKAAHAGTTMLLECREAELAAERARSAKLASGIKSILPAPPYHPLLEPEWVYLSGLVDKGGNAP